jgi:hypothetical protein
VVCGNVLRGVYKGCEQQRMRAVFGGGALARKGSSADLRGRVRAEPSRFSPMSTTMRIRMLLILALPSALAWRLCRAPRMCAAAVPWESLKASLDDSVPVFVVTDEAQRPLASQPRVLCFLDAVAAQSELVRAKDEYPSLDLRLQPVGLGTALERARLGRASVVPSAEELDVARAAFPDGEDWEGGALPLFGAYEMQRKRRDGTLATPLFLSVEDAKAACREADPQRELGLELVCTSVQRMVSLVVAGEVGAMDFVPTATAVELTQRCAAVGAEAGELPPGVTRAMITRSLPSWYSEDEEDPTQQSLFGL